MKFRDCSMQKQFYADRTMIIIQSRWWTFNEWFFIFDEWTRSNGNYLCDFNISRAVYLEILFVRDFRINTRTSPVIVIALKHSCVKTSPFINVLDADIEDQRNAISRLNNCKKRFANSISQQNAKLLYLVFVIIILLNFTYHFLNLCFLDFS